VHFLIEPNESARRELPAILDRGDAELLLEPWLTSRRYADQSSWREDDAELAVKLIFVARMREYTPLESDAEADRILGSSRISSEVFDRWWNIRRLHEWEGSSEQLEDYLRQMIAKTQPTGNPVVDEWLRRIKDGAA
jgi:hypothetical protein